MKRLLVEENSNTYKVVLPKISNKPDQASRFNSLLQEIQRIEEHMKHFATNNRRMQSSKARLQETLPGSLNKYFPRGYIMIKGEMYRI